MKKFFYEYLDEIVVVMFFVTIIAINACKA